MLALRAGPPRARPAPYDMIMGNHGLMLGAASKGGQLMLSKPKDLAGVVPTDYEYSAQNPILESVAAYDDLSLGFGLRIQQNRTDRLYRYALNADCSVRRLWMKGPELTTASIPSADASNAPNRAFEFGGSVYILNGRYAYVMVADVPTLSKDFGSGKVATDVIVFYNNAAGGAQYAYVAMGDSEAIWRLGPTFGVQTVAITGTPTGGTYRLNYNGFWTGQLVYNASAATVQAALTAIPGLSAVTVTATGVSPNYTHTVTFVGVASPATLTSASSLTGGAPVITVATPTAYVAAAWEQRVEVQTLAVTGTPTGGTYTLSYGGTLTTASINFNDSAATVQTRLRTLTGLSAVTVTSVGDNPDFTFTVTFVGVGTAAIQLTATNSLTGGSTPTITQARIRNVLYARAFAIVNREFWRGSSVNTVAKVDIDADPWLEENWSAANSFTIGDRSQGITRLGVTATGTLIVFKTDGPHSLDDAGDDHALYPHLRQTPDTAGGEALGAWINDLYVSYQSGTYRLSADLTLEEIGPERISSNDSIVKGRMTAFCGHDTFNLYSGIYNNDTGDSYLLKFGAWSQRDVGPTEEQSASRIDAWHGSITPAFTDKKITCLFRSTVGAPTNHQRMYILLYDTTGSGAHQVSIFTLPCEPNPAACTSYTFSTADAYVYLPIWHGMFQGDQKALRAVTMTATNFSSTNYAQYEFRSDLSGLYQALGTDFNSGQRQKVEFDVGTSAVLLDGVVILKSTVNTSSPQITGFGLHHQLRTALYQVLTFRVLAADGLTKRDGTPYRVMANRVRDLCRSFVNSSSSVAIIAPDQKTYQVTVVGYNEVMGWSERHRRWYSAVELECTETVTATIFGTYDRMSAYSYSYLETLTYGQIESI